LTGAGSDPEISQDGRYVAFNSGSSNLVPDDTNGPLDVFVADPEQLR
jgi:Tol biopolymer transport system component